MSDSEGACSAAPEDRYAGMTLGEALQSVADDVDTMQQLVREADWAGNEQDAVDAVTEAYLAIQTKRADVRVDRPLAYVKAAVRNFARSMVRRSIRHGAASFEESAHVAPVPSEADELKGDALARLPEAIDSLPEPQRLVIHKQFLLGQRLKQVARDLGIGEEAAKKRSQRARQGLLDWFRTNRVANPWGADELVLSHA